MILHPWWPLRGCGWSCSSQGLGLLFFLMRRGILNICYQISQISATQEEQANHFEMTLQLQRPVKLQEKVSRSPHNWHAIWTCQFTQRFGNVTLYSRSSSDFYPLFSSFCLKPPTPVIDLRDPILENKFTWSGVRHCLACFYFLYRRKSRLSLFFLTDPICF